MLQYFLLIHHSAIITIFTDVLSTYLIKEITKSLEFFWLIEIILVFNFFTPIKLLKEQLQTGFLILIPLINFIYNYEKKSILK